MSEFLKHAIELLKLAPRYLVALAAVAGLLLFMPDPWLLKLGLKDVTDSYRPWLGLAFLTCSALCGVATSIWLGGIVGRWKARRSVMRHIIRKLNDLTENEKQILRYYIAEDTRANSLRVDDGVVQGLVADRIIYQSAKIGDLVEGFAHNITPTAWDYLRANPHVLNGETDTYRTDKCERHSHYY